MLHHSLQHPLTIETLRRVVPLNASAASGSMDTVPLMAAALPVRIEIFDECLVQEACTVIFDLGEDGGIVVWPAIVSLGIFLTTYSWNGKSRASQWKVRGLDMRGSHMIGSERVHVFGVCLFGIFAE